MGAFALEHLNLYVTGRCWWDANLDVEALLEEYCRLFYGPARDEMRAFIAYCEANGPALRREPARIDQVFELIERAQAKAEPASVHGQRLALIAEYLAPLRDIQTELSKGRENVPRAVLADRDGRAATLDGRLDEAFWKDVPEYALRDLATGAPPVSKGSFKAAWADGSLYVGIVCLESDMASLNIAAVRNKDTTIWKGDCIEVLLETPVHSYYQLAVSPAGAVMDLDRKQGFNSRWMSNAEVAAFHGADRWCLEMRIPVANELQAEIDPLHGVAGGRPSVERPWYFNVCRQRMRAQDQEYSAFSPTIKGGFNVVRKFAELVLE